MQVSSKMSGHYQTMKFVKLFLLLAAVMVGSTNVWGWQGARVYVKSQPQGGGYVYAGTSTGGSTGTLTEDKAELSNGKLSEQTFTFYLYATAKPGYTFKGWSTSSTATSGTVSSPYSVGLKGNKLTAYNEYTYYAIFKANTYTVSFDANGGTTPTYSKTVTYDATYADLPTPTWANHRFDGWFTAETGGIQITSTTSVTITSNQTLYAHWTNIYEGTFYTYAKGNGQTWITVNGTSFTGNFSQANDNSSKSYTQNTTPTYPVECYAKPEAGYTFAGWYDNENCTGTPLSTSTANWCKLSENIEASELVVTKKYYAKFTPGITYYAKAYSEARPNVAGVGLTYVSCQGNNPSSDANYTASDKRDYSTNSLTTQTGSGTIRADYYAKALAGYKFGGWYRDAACTELAGAGDANDRNHYVEDIVSTVTSSPGKEVTRYAKFDAVTVSAATAQTKSFTATGTQTATLQFPVSNASSNADFNAPTISGDAGWSITAWNYANNYVSVTLSYTATEGTTTIGDHTAVVTVKAKSNNSATGNVTASVSINPTFTCNIASTYQVDDNALNLNSLWTSNGNGSITYSVVSFTPTGANNTGATTPAISGSTLTLGQAGTLVIQLSQAAGTTNNAGTTTKTISITKHVPAISFSFQPYYRNKAYSNVFTIDSGDASLFSSSSGDTQVASIYDLNKLTTYSKDASTTITVTATENYKWQGKKFTTNIHPSVAPNHVPLVITQDNYSSLVCSYAKEYAWDGGIRVAGTDAKYAFDWDDRYVIIHFEGIPDKLSFSCSNSTASSGTDFYVAEGASQENMTQTWSAGGATSNVVLQLQPTTRYVKLCYSGNYAGYFKNITISELHTFATDSSSLNFGSENRKDVLCASQTFKFSYANVGHNVTLTTNDPHFTVSPSSITTIGGDRNGSQTITVSYSTAEVHEASNAKLTIADELGNTRELTLKGKTTKKVQTLAWASDYQANQPTVVVGKTIGNAASASSTLPVTYTSDNTEVIEIITLGNGESAFRAKKAGSATITATQNGNEDWESVSISKVFKATEKTIQLIDWNQNLTHLLTTDNYVPLTARVLLLTDPENNGKDYSKERTDMMTYTSGDESVIRVEKEGAAYRIAIVGKGTTTLTASVAGDDTYESASSSMTVVVREPSTGCEDELISTDLTGSYEFFHMNLNAIDKVIQITGQGIPGTMTFQSKREKWGANTSGTLEVRESTDGGHSWSNVLYTVTPNLSNYTPSSSISLSRNVTHLKFTRPYGATGYHYIKDIEITPAQFIESSSSSVDFGNVSVNSIEAKSVTISYSNAKGRLSVSSDNESVKVPEYIELDCGATGSTSLQITFQPTSVVPVNATITISDNISGKSCQFAVKATASKATQSITWNPSATTFYCDESLDLSATASSANTVKYYVNGDEGKQVANFDNSGNLIVYKPGTITIVAYQEGDAVWEAAAEVEKTFTLNIVPLTMTTAPAASAIDYMKSLDQSSLTDGEVQNHRGEVVLGTFAWSNPATMLNAGDNQDMLLTFTPSAHPAWYSFQQNATTKVNVNKISPVAGTPSATAIYYGQTIGESILTAEGATTTGAWAWDESVRDEKKNAGTYSNLPVVFTPTGSDATNYTSLSSTVSLTVNKMDPAATLSATNIIYGQRINESSLANTGSVAGTWSWKAETANEEVRPVGTYSNLNVHFTPTDTANYNEIDDVVSVMVNKATPLLTWTTAPENVSELSTYLASTTNTDSQDIIYSVVSGGEYASIDAQTGILTPIANGIITVQAAQTATSNFEAPASLTVQVTIALLPTSFAFINATGDGTWDNPSNWSTGVVPSKTDGVDVVVSGDMTINETIVVGSLTIEQNAKVVLVSGGHLTVNGKSESRPHYGDLYVKNGGIAVLQDSLSVNDFVLETSIGTADGSATSGQAVNATYIRYLNGAYIDINMDPSGKMNDTKWYGFTVPFPVDAQQGVARKEGDSFRKCTYGDEYVIAEYDVEQRLRTGKGWKYYRGVLQPGHFYFFTVDGDYNVYSFKANTNTYSGNTSVSLTTNGTGKDANWNAVGNSTLQYANASFTNEGGAPTYVQVYQNGLDAYKAVSTDDANFVVGCPFFIQATQASTLTLNPANGAQEQYFAPQRATTTDGSIAAFRLQLAPVSGGPSDQIYLSADAKEQDAYRLGYDLSKVGVGTVSAQMWANAYGKQLCVHQADMQYHEAMCNLGIYAPRTGGYVISAVHVPNNAQVYLTLDGQPVWNLSESEYELSLPKGTSSEYGILLVAGRTEATEVENTQQDKENQVEKIVRQGHLYILKDGKMYDASGAQLK